MRAARSIPLVLAGALAPLVALAQPAEPQPPAPTATPSASAEPTAPAPSASAAEPPAEPSATGFHFGLRAGYQAPFGTAKAGALRDIVAGSLAFGAEGGWFFDRRLYVGGYFVYGYAFTANTSGSVCPVNPDDQCSAALFRFGAVGRWHFAPEQSLDPWAGFALGYEVLNVHETDSSGAPAGSASLHGFEASLQLGADYEPRPYYGLGPFVELGLGHYAYDGGGTPIHGWIGAGVRLHSGI